MDWLSQNWLWVAVGIGALLFFFRGGFGGHGLGHHGAGGMLGGMGHGAGGGSVDEPELAGAGVPAAGPDAAVDPVSEEPVRADRALTSLYQGKIYYFASKENRDRFEAAPQQYAHKAVGRAVEPAGGREYRPRRRGGC